MLVKNIFKTHSPISPYIIGIVESEAEDHGIHFKSAKKLDKLKFFKLLNSIKRSFGLEFIFFSHGKD